MQIVINHLTRMRNGYICVAGVDLDSGRHVRPRSTQRLTLDSSSKYGGVLGIGEVVDLGQVRHVGRTPEVEDYAFSMTRLRRIRTAKPDEFWELMQNVARCSLLDIFGPALEPDGRTRSVQVGRGRASLGCLHVTGRPSLFIATVAAPQLRMVFHDNGSELWVAVTDLRLHDARFEPDPWRVKMLKKRIDNGVPIILSVGLSRKYQKSIGNEPRHWLQVNNIHLGDGPLRRM